MDNISNVHESNHIRPGCRHGAYHIHCMRIPEAIVLAKRYTTNIYGARSIKDDCSGVPPRWHLERRRRFWLRLFTI